MKKILGKILFFASMAILIAFLGILLIIAAIQDFGISIFLIVPVAITYILGSAVFSLWDLD